MINKAHAAIILAFCSFAVSGLTACSNDDYAHHVAAVHGYPIPPNWDEQQPVPPPPPPPPSSHAFSERILNEPDMVVPDMPPPPPPHPHKKPKPDLLDAS